MYGDSNWLRTSDLCILFDSYQTSWLRTGFVPNLFQYYDGLCCSQLSGESFFRSPILGNSPSLPLLFLKFQVNFNESVQRLFRQFLSANASSLRFRLVWAVHSHHLLCFSHPGLLTCLCVIRVDTPKTTQIFSCI